MWLRRVQTRYFQDSSVVSKRIGEFKLENTNREDGRGFEIVGVYMKKFIGAILEELIDQEVLSKECGEVASTENRLFGKAVEKEESDFMLVKERPEAMKKEVSLPRSASESKQQLTVSNYDLNSGESNVVACRFRNKIESLP
ncbi:hypothetical protein YC2023_085092 [Brassica napus]